MPYVDKNRRPELDIIVEDMVHYEVKPNGDINYILFKLCKHIVEPSYNNYKNFIGELNECAAEIRRRFLSPYEDMKIDLNGDVE